MLSPRALKLATKSCSVPKRHLSFTCHLLSDASSFKVDNSLLMKLRKETQIQISKAREALQHSNNDYHKALEWLQKDLQTAGAKKADKVKDRVAKEGVVSVYIDNSKPAASIIALSCETDFVSRNDNFAQLASQIAKTATDNLEQLSAPNTGLIHENSTVLETPSSTKDQLKVSELINESIARLSENIVLKSVFTQSFDTPNTFISSYVHGKSASDPNTGKIASIVSFSAVPSLYQNAEFIKLTKRIAQQVVAFKPTALASEKESSSSSGAVIDSSAQDDLPLLDLEFMFGGGSVRDILLAASQKFGSPIEISSIKWFEVGN